MEVCAKTGTAQKAAPDGGYLRDAYISSFAGFFPKQNPQYLILVILDEVGTYPVWGGATAGRIFKDIGTRIIKTVEGGILVDGKPDAGEDGLESSQSPVGGEEQTGPQTLN